MHLWPTRGISSFGMFLTCLNCAGRLHLVRLGEGDAEAQAWLEAWHISRALADAEAQQKLVEQAEQALTQRFVDSAIHEIYGAEANREESDGDREQLPLGADGENL